MPTGKSSKKTSNPLLDVPTMYEIRQMMLQSKGQLDLPDVGSSQQGLGIVPNPDREVLPAVDVDEGDLISDRLQRIDETILHTDEETKSLEKESGDSDDQSSTGRPTRRRLSLGALTAPLGRQLFGKQRSNTMESGTMNTSQDSVKQQKSPKGALRMFRKKGGTPVSSSVHTLESDEAEEGRVYKKRAHTYTATEGRKLMMQTKPALSAQLSQMSTSSDDSGIDSVDRVRDKEEGESVERRERTKKKRRGFGEKIARVRSKSLGYIFGWFVGVW